MEHVCLQRKRSGEALGQHRSVLPYQCDSVLPGLSLILGLCPAGEGWPSSSLRSTCSAAPSPLQSLDPSTCGPQT